MPYERPPLSKGLLAGREQASDILINDEAFYAEQGITTMLDTPVVRVDFDARTLHVERGEPLTYETLIIATGARPRTFDIPGAHADGVYYLRTIGDARAIREAASVAKRAVTIGGGFISMEFASVLASQGVDTTMVFPEERVWARLFHARDLRVFRALLP
ncbi:MAG: FAD-dependent oxidoreductase [Dehalococcoidia bacterium]